MREPPATPPDRRQTPRTKLVEIAYIGMGPENGGLVLDVSDGGLSFHAVAPVQPAEKINFLLSLRGHSRIEGSGEVVWTNEMKTVCGMKFISLSSGAREHLNQWTTQSKMPSARGKFVPSPVRPAKTAPQPVPERPKISSTAPALTAAPAPATTPTFAVAPDFIAPLSFPAEKSIWQKPFFLWILFAIFATGLTAIAFNYGVQVGRSQSGAVASPASADQLPANSSAETTQPTASSSAPATDEAQTPSSASPAPAVVAPAQNGSFVNASKTDDGTGTPGTSPETDADSGASREQRSEQMLEAGQSELAAAQASLRGDSGPRNSAKAARLLWAAVGNGNSEAEVILADLYLLGDGVPKSCEQGRILLTAAFKSGNAEAREKLNELNKNGCQ